jgi:hypothetical protein
MFYPAEIRFSKRTRNACGGHAGVGVCGSNRADLWKGADGMTVS